MIIHFFKSDISENMFNDNKYFKNSLAPYSQDNESFLDSLLAVPLQIFFEEMIYSMNIAAHALTTFSEFTMALSTREEALVHLEKAGENCLHTFAYLLMMLIVPFVAICRPIMRLSATADEGIQSSRPC